MRKALVKHVRKEIGPIATPDVIQWAPGLPKTRSGKIMRRILRKIAENEVDKVGDTSTLADPSVVEDLVRESAATCRSRQAGGRTPSASAAASSRRMAAGCRSRAIA